MLELPWSGGLPLRLPLERPNHASGSRHGRTRVSRHRTIHVIHTDVLVQMSDERESPQATIGVAGDRGDSSPTVVRWRRPRRSSTLVSSCVRSKRGRTTTRKTASVNSSGPSTSARRVTRSESGIEPANRGPHPISACRLRPPRTLFQRVVPSNGRSTDCSVAPVRAGALDRVTAGKRCLEYPWPVLRQSFSCATGPHRKEPELGMQIYTKWYVF